VTPVSDAEQVAATLPHSLSIVIPAGSHNDGGLPGAGTCIASIANQFVERGGGSGLDTSCVERLRRAPFPTTPVATKATPLTPQQQTALVGHYAAEGGPALDIVLDRGRLIATMQGESEKITLIAISPERLRLLGLFAAYLDVELQNGRAFQVTLEQSGARVLTWRRAGD
jgi:hypothetical protein